MQRSLIAAVAAFLAFANPVAAQDSTLETDDQRIREAVADYFWGRQNADQDRLAEAFDLETGHMKFIVDGDNGEEAVRIVTLADFRARLTEPLDTPTRGEIVALDIVDGRMAFAKLRLTGAESTFIDYLLLYKIDGVWKIVNKMFVRR